MVSCTTQQANTNVAENSVVEENPSQQEVLSKPKEPEIPLSNGQTSIASNDSESPVERQEEQNSELSDVLPPADSSAQTTKAKLVKFDSLASYSQDQPGREPGTLVKESVKTTESEHNLIAEYSAPLPTDAKGLLVEAGHDEVNYSIIEEDATKRDSSSIPQSSVPSVKGKEGLVVPIIEETQLPITEEMNEGHSMVLLIFLVVVVCILLLILILTRRTLQNLREKLDAENRRIVQLGVSDLESAQKKMEQFKDTIQRLDTEIIQLGAQRMEFRSEKNDLESKCGSLEKKLENLKLKLSRTKELYAAVEHAVLNFHEAEIPSTYYKPLSEYDKTDLDSLAPTVMLNLNYMNYQDLRKEFRANQKQIDSLLESYAQRYTTKANQSIYQLMVLSLRSELQNILYNLKHEKLDVALLQVQSLIAKYLVIVSEGNQQIAGTMRKFVGELEHLFINAVKIEYEYFIKKEQARQEQLALRQQMREEAEERKRLEEQKKQIALEESKYQSEIEKIQSLFDLEPEDSVKRQGYQKRLDELNVQLAQVEEKKEEITKLQNGKAGNVYIISNLGSFGDHVFKIGMTRRLDPQERVDELGSASVPFKFDVHSFIFSEDAVGLENALHQRLHANRLNKVNLRKEFFDVSLEELEALVDEINPTAEFNRTMMADDYKQSLSMGDQELELSENFEEMEEDDD